MNAHGKIRVGLFGTEGHQIHAALENHPGAELAAVAAFQPEACPPWFTEQGVKVLGSLDELLAQHTFQHELQVAADAGMLGSIDANRGDYQNGWDTDQFPMNIQEITEAMLVILSTGGLQGGGVNFDAKVRRNSTDLDDLFIAHISGMDTFARALLAAESILAKSRLPLLKKARYASFDNGDGARFEAGALALEDLAAIGAAGGEPTLTSGKQELYEAIVNEAI